MVQICSRPDQCERHICMDPQPIAKDILALCNMVRAYLDRSKGACIVHCNDSIGRSGVFIGLMKLTMEIDSNPDEINICLTVFDMRACRMKMVRTICMLIRNVNYKWYITGQRFQPLQGSVQACRDLHQREGCPESLRLHLFT